MASRRYFEYIRNVWKNLPSIDQDRLAELWKGYEQALAAVYQKYAEVSLNTSIENIFAFSDERWLNYTFNSDNFQDKAATYRTNQDLSQGVSLVSRYLLSFSWDEESPIEVDLRGFDPNRTTINEVVEKINIAAGFTIVKTVVSDALLEFTSPTIGTQSRIFFHPTSDPTLNACESILGISAQDLPVEIPQFPFCYSIPYPSLVSIPKLQDAIRPDNVTTALIENVDYVISGSEICFKQAPPEAMWASRNLFDEEWPWNNFGFLMGIYQQNSERYIEVLQGLWFAFWTGPRPENLRRALYLLFGLPTSPYDGTVTRLTATEIDVTSDTGTTTTFEIPTNLTSLVALGERVAEFQPLVSGIDVFDKVNNPGFIETEVGRVGIQRFLTDDATRGTGPDTDETKALRLLEEYTFLPQISVDAFINQDVNIGNVRLFLDAIKPVVKTYLFQVIIGVFRDEIGLTDRLGIHLDIDVTPNVDSNETTWQPASVLDSHEITANTGLTVDTEGILFLETVGITVHTTGDPGDVIDEFEA